MITKQKFNFIIKKIIIGGVILKKILIFILILMMAVPFQVFANVKLNELPEKAKEDLNGIFEISVEVENKWINAGNLEFGKFQETKEMNLEEFIKNDATLIKITQKGGGASYIDAVFLCDAAPVKANYSEDKILNKLIKEDLDITPVGDGIILEFLANSGEKILSVTGRIENEIISQEPLQFPIANNYKQKNQIADFYSYKLNSNIGKITVDGVLDEVENMGTFAKEYQVPGSGHPAGDTYFWVMNDDVNLYVTIDVTPDNTYDGDKDYAKVYINTSEEVKEYRISVPETKWGNTAFTYTDKAAYEHKVYEFVIPFSEIGSTTDELELAFVVYGTVSVPEIYNEESEPSLAYHSGLDMYLSVFTYLSYDYHGFYISQIYGQIIDNKGNPIGNKFLINDGTEYSGANQLQLPSVAVDENNNFLVTWTQDYGYSKIYAAKVVITKTDESYNVDVGTAFRVSNNEDKDSLNGGYYEYYNEHSSVIAYDSLKNRFLIVWQQYLNGSSPDQPDSSDNIYGSIVSINSDFNKSTFPICDIPVSNQKYPSASYSTEQNKFLVAWYEDAGVSKIISTQAVGNNGEVNTNDRLTIAVDAMNPNVSYNNTNNKFLITWTDVFEDEIYGTYYSINDVIDDMDDIVKFDISANSLDEFGSCYSASYFDGYDKMLCVWSPNYEANYKAASISINEVYGGFAELNYVDSDGKIGTPFFTDYDPNDRDIVAFYEPIAITGNLMGQFLIAYEIDNSFVEDYYTPTRIGYRLIGDFEPQPQPYIEFDKEVYEVEVKDTTQAKVTLYDYFPTLLQSINEDIDVTGDVIYEFDSDYITVDNMGVITGVNQTPTSEPTTILAYLNPAKPEPTFLLMDYSEEDPNISEDALIAEAKVIVTKAKEPGLEFEDDPYSVQLGKTLQTKVNYFDGKNYIDVTDSVLEYKSGNTEIATITSGGAITGITAGHTTASAIYYENDIQYTAMADVNVYKKSSPSPAPEKTPIGQVIVDNKVIKNIYPEDLVLDGGIYSFEASKTGDNAKLWLLGSYYKQIANKNPNGTLQLVWDAASYNLPLKCENVLKDANSISDSKVNIILEKVNDKELIVSAVAAVDKLSGKMVSVPVDFNVTIEGNSKTVIIDSYDLYVERTIDQLNKLDSYSTTAMKLILDDEVFTFAPSVFNGSTATIKYRGNGIFAVINNPKTFNDITNHWSKMNVEKLAARNIAFGKDENTFAPNDFVTRAEFAVMITRALGITEEEGTINFDDVKGWFEEDISTAYEAGLINGRSDGKFYPNDRIQRKDMAVMIHNAIKFANKEVTVKNIEKVLSMFADSAEIDEYAKESTAICTDAGIIMGRDTKEFDPDENATRAEASAIIERMLRYLEFIN